MGKSLIDRTFGREAFGANPASYHLARPAYPDRAVGAASRMAPLQLAPVRERQLVVDLISERTPWSPSNRTLALRPSFARPSRTERL